MRFFIIGFKSSGKTTLGKKLARMLGMDFIDLDHLITHITGKSIPEIYTTEGEERFRKIERMALHEAVKTDNVVISTGGGTPCYSDNMSVMENHGVVIYIELDTKTLVSRLLRAAGDRPIVMGKSREELNRYVEELKERCGDILVRARYILNGKKSDLQGLVCQLKQDFRI